MHIIRATGNSLNELGRLGCRTGLASTLLRPARPAAVRVASRSVICRAKLAWCQPRWACLVMPWRVICKKRRHVACRRPGGLLFHVPLSRAEGVIVLLQFQPSLPCNRVGGVNRLRAWVLLFFACSWSPTAGFFKPGGLQRPAHQARRFCRCRLRETSHMPTVSLAPHPPRRVQEPKESRRGTHECPLFICNRDY